MKSVILKSYSETVPSIENFAIEEREIPKVTIDKEFLVKVLYISVDPFLRGRMNPKLKSYLPHYELEKPISGLVVGQVVERKDPSDVDPESIKFPVGSIVSGYGEFCEYVILSEYSPLVMKVDLPPEQASHALGVIGVPGVTAYFGFYDICQPKEGETILISGAGGAIGSLVGQLAKLKNCQVIGITSSDEKKRILIEELGFHKCINYKSIGESNENDKDKVDSLKEIIFSLAPRGVDMYFDNVGGEITDSVLQTMNVGGRVCICGTMSAYHFNEKEDLGPRQWSTILSHGLTLKGFRIIREYESKYFDGLNEMKDLFLNGKLIAKENFSFGIEAVPEAFVSLFYGKDIGKKIIKL